MGMCAMHGIGIGSKARKIVVVVAFVLTVFKVQSQSEGLVS